MGGGQCQCLVWLLGHTRTPCIPEIASRNAVFVDTSKGVKIPDSSGCSGQRGQLQRREADFYKLNYIGTLSRSVRKPNPYARSGLDGGPLATAAYPEAANFA